MNPAGEYLKVSIVNPECKQYKLCDVIWCTVYTLLIRNVGLEKFPGIVSLLNHYHRSSSFLEVLFRKPIECIV